MEKQRGYFHLLSIGDTLFALGGIYVRDGDGKYVFSYLADVEEFVEETGTWKPAKSLGGWISGKRGWYGGVAVTRDLVCG